MKITQTIIDEILVHAREGYPDEVCGLMAGRDGTISRVFRTTNIDKSSISYMMEPAEQFRAFKEMRAEGLELLAIYHSHPTSPAYPSQTDVRLAFYPEAVYVIVSLRKVGNTEVKGFRILDGKISEEVLEIIP
ncbi:MAG: M67 family metallopeptidase [Deltaproteobacteria bacterium]|nr:M67 family metallopeptidase [Deltaproteobacteria bacterium]